MPKILCKGGISNHGKYFEQATFKNIRVYTFSNICLGI